MMNNKMGGVADRLISRMDKPGISKTVPQAQEKKRTTIYLDPGVITQLDSIARCKGIPRTELVESIVADALQTPENQKIIDAFKSMTQQLNYS